MTALVSPWIVLSGEKESQRCRLLCDLIAALALYRFHDSTLPRAFCGPDLLAASNACCLTVCRALGRLGVGVHTTRPCLRLSSVA